ncbi:hypothetical protein, partial [Limnobacter sp. CACIAM 66H1]|uniref:hypothetical protein n=1 Tax=Limnobacter sp. CACIAM 66H1 TaxID=1813033 RepID=UPI0025C45327
MGRTASCLVWLCLLFSLVGCVGGDDNASVAGTRVQPGQTDSRLDQFNIANQCFSVATADGRFLEVGSGSYSLGNAPSPFFFKPSRLGQYLLLDSDAGFLGLSNSNPFNQAQLIQFLRTGTDFLSGLGDLAEVIEPLKPVSDGVRQAGESLGEAIDQQSAVSSSDSTPFAQAEPGFLTVWEIIPASRQNSFRFRQLVTQQFLAIQGEGLALVSGEADAGSFVLQPASGCAL